MNSLQPITLVNWTRVNSPHPSALPNLNLVVQHMMTNGITNANAAISPFLLSKVLNKDVNNLRALLKSRPGFVAIEVGPRKFRYFWLADVFGSTYPATFSAQHKNTEVPLVLGEIRPESEPSVPRATTRAANEILKQVGTKFDHEGPATENTKYTARIPYRDISALTKNELREAVFGMINNNRWDQFAMVAVAVAAAVKNNGLSVLDDDVTVEVTTVTD